MNLGVPKGREGIKVVQFQARGISEQAFYDRRHPCEPENLPNYLKEQALGGGGICFKDLLGG